MGAPISGGPPSRTPPGHYVYALTAPGSSEVRYVGLTRDPRTRWHMHVSNARHAERAGDQLCPLYLWILELHARGERCVMTFLATTREGIATGRALEECWIERLRKAGAALLNGRGPACARCGAVGHCAPTCGAPKQDTAVPRPIAHAASAHP